MRPISIIPALPGLEGPCTPSQAPGQRCLLGALGTGGALAEGWRQHRVLRRTSATGPAAFACCAALRFTPGLPGPTTAEPQLAQEDAD